MGRVNGVWVGWMLGDNSATDMTVRRAKAYMRAMFASYAGMLADTNIFDRQMYDVVCIMQDKLVARPMTATKLVPGNFIRGVLDLPTQLAMGFKKLDPVLPIEFTVEGHLSNLFIGPAAGNAQTLEAQGVCHAKPVNYDCQSLPFNDKSGVEALVAMLSAPSVEGPPIDINNPDGLKVKWPFPIGTPWGIVGFSQGAEIVSQFMEQEVLSPNGRCHNRLGSFKRGLALGNPRREYGKVCAWSANPPPANTGGILDHQFVTTGTVIESRWAENCNNGDLFSCNTKDAAGADKTAIAKIICENGWGGSAGIFARVLLLFGNPVGGAFAAVKAIFDAIMFAVHNPNPHYATITEQGDLDWMRGVANG